LVDVFIYVNDEFILSAQNIASSAKITANAETTGDLSKLLDTSHLTYVELKPGSKGSWLLLDLQMVTKIGEMEVYFDYTWTSKCLQHQADQVSQTFDKKGLNS